MALLHAPASTPGGVPPGATRTAAILGIASYLPDEIITNADLEAMVETSDAWILERTGIRERRKIASGMTTSMMAAEAGRRAMAAARVDSVDALIVATVSPGGRGSPAHRATGTDRECAAAPLTPIGPATPPSRRRRLLVEIGGACRAGPDPGPPSAERVRYPGHVPPTSFRGATCHLSPGHMQDGPVRCGAVR